MGLINTFVSFPAVMSPQVQDLGHVHMPCHTTVQLLLQNPSWAEPAGQNPMGSHLHQRAPVIAALEPPVTEPTPQPRRLPKGTPRQILLDRS